MVKILPIQREIRKKKNPAQARVLQNFFKTAPGEYGEGDVFLGLKVPETRRIVSRYPKLPLRDIEILLNSKIHEERLAGVLALVARFEFSDENERKKLYTFYLSHARRINNWDLVDLSASRIVGEYLLEKNRSILYTLAKSRLLWERRIAIIATYRFIQAGEHKDTFRLAESLFGDSEDLMHKAVGWMLREVGKRISEDLLEKYLRKHIHAIPRTALRYAIERFPEKKRKEILHYGKN